MAGRSVAGDEFEVDGVTVHGERQAGPTVARKPKTAPAPADVVDATPVTSGAGVAAEEKAAAGGAQPPAAPAAAAGAAMCGPGEIAYLRNKAKSIDVDLAEVNPQGFVIEAGKLSKADFDTIKAELMKRGA
jgi:hypothetical protein